MLQNEKTENKLVDVRPIEVGSRAMKYTTRFVCERRLVYSNNNGLGDFIITNKG